MNIDSLLNNALVFDLETSSHYADGREINIRSNFDDYVMMAKIKWFGAYSYKNKEEYYLEMSKDRNKIINLLQTHNVLIGFNNEEFDYPIIVNNYLVDRKQKFNHIDCMKILGASSFIDKNGFKYKDRGNLMGYKFKRNSLECMAQTMKLEFQKSKIDYTIFHKDSYTDEEKKEIIKYLKNDIMTNKGMFDKLWTYWMPFTDLIDWKYVSNFSWIKSSIASLIYKSACFCINTEPTYSEHKSKVEEMGGKVLMPKYEEVKDAWYVDFSSLYPHIMCMFNLFAEDSSNNKEKHWHGNEMFKVKGYYDISHKHHLTKAVEEKLLERTELKKKDPDNPMVQTLKIWLNGLYGILRSALFEKVHTPNGGWDTCWLGQQITDFTQKELEKYGFEATYGDTDSRMLLAKSKKHCDRDYLVTCLKQIVKKILANVPFPVETFDIAIETFTPYMLFPFAEQELVDEDTRKLLNTSPVEGYLREEQDGKKVIIDTTTNKIVKRGRSWIKTRRGKKKNYLYLYEEDEELKVKLVGLPIKKDNATALGIKIYKEILKPLILKNKRAKFPREFIDKQIEEYLKDKEIMKLISREFKIKPYNTYKVPKGMEEPSTIYAQISKGYFNKGEGVINLIKNKKVGNAGKGTLYCTVDEAIESKLTIDDLDLEKLYNELEPFIEYVEVKEKVKEKLTLKQ